MTLSVDPVGQRYCTSGSLRSSTMMSTSNERTQMQRRRLLSGNAKNAIRQKPHIGNVRCSRRP